MANWSLLQGNEEVNKRIKPKKCIFQKGNWELRIKQWELTSIWQVGFSKIRCWCEILAWDAVLGKKMEWGRYDRHLLGKRRVRMQDQDDPTPSPPPPLQTLPKICTSSSSSSLSSSLLFIHGKNNQAKYTIYNILKMFTNYRIKGNSIYKDECWNK